MEVEDQQKSKLVTIEYCAKSTWTHVCEGFLTIGDICNYCQCPGDTISTGINQAMELFLLSHYNSSV